MPRKANERQGFHVFSINDDVVRPPPQQPEPNFATIIDYENDFKILNSAHHQLTLDISTLLNNSKTSRRAAKLRREGKLEAPRPQNAWILYRKDINARFRQTGEHEGKKSSLISKIIAEMWENEREEVKKMFFVLAKWAGYVHKEVNDEYRYSPRRSGERSPETLPGDPLVNYEFDPNLSNLSSPYPEHPITEFPEFPIPIPFEFPQTFYFPDSGTEEIHVPYVLVPSSTEMIYFPDYDVYLPSLYLCDIDYMI
uniref:MATA-HMG n=2 Tax=Rhizophagus irregularis TaxID=588596 RepID=A0A1B1EVD0_9GLOM|nr:MATA-HMG [Rhizophagus irregularis]